MSAMHAGAKSERPAWMQLRDGLQTLGLVLLGLSLFGSVAGINIAKGMLLLVFLSYVPTLRRAAPWREPTVAAGLVLLLYILLVSLVHDGFSRAIMPVLSHYQELLLVPVLLVLIRSARHPRALLYALLAGAVLVACAHWYALLTQLSPDVLGARRISAGFMLSIAAFAALACSIGHPRPWALRILAVLFAITTVFAVGGRTGYVTLLLLTLYAAFSLSSKRWRWWAVLLGGALLVAAVFNSHEARLRMEETVNVARQGLSTDAIRQTSSAIRVHMLEISEDIVREHGLVGLGYAGYSKAYRAAVEKRMARDPALYAKAPAIWLHSDNPHNEYLMQLLGGGIFGLMLFCLWLTVALREAHALPQPYRLVARGLCFAFAVGCLFNSLLLDFSEGHFFVVVLAYSLCAGKARQPQPSS